MEVTHLLTHVPSDPTVQLQVISLLRAFTSLSVEEAKSVVRELRETALDLRSLPWVRPLSASRPHEPPTEELLQEMIDGLRLLGCTVSQQYHGFLWKATCGNTYLGIARGDYGPVISDRYTALDMWAYKEDAQQSLADWQANPGVQCYQLLRSVDWQLIRIDTVLEQSVYEVK